MNWLTDAPAAGAFPRAPGRLARRRALGAALVFVMRMAFGQETSSDAYPGPAATQTPPQPQVPYTIKSGDFRLLLTPSVEFDWNDNITLVKDNPIQSYIVKPLLGINASYPFSQRNLLQLNVGVGYDFYLQHNEFSGLLLTSDSEVAFDAYVKDWRFNVHDRFEYIQDPAEQASVAGTGKYGGLDNFAGLSGTWDLRDVVSTVGYDHENYVASSAQFNYLDRATELPVARVGFHLNPKVTVGVEALGAFTTYQQPVLNNNQGYTGEAFAEWTPGTYFQVEARAGYCAYFVDQTSLTVKAVNESTPCGSLTLSHEASKALSYSLSAGHEIQLGTSADLIKDTYARFRMDLRVTKDVTLSPYLYYEHGQQGEPNETGALFEIYNWMGTGLSFNYRLTRRFVTTLKYRLTLRTSDVPSREYSQNLVGIQLTYLPE